MEDIQTNLTRLKDAYREWHETRGGSVQTWLDLMSDKVRFRSLAGGVDPMAFTLDCESKSDVQRYFQGLLSDWEMIYYKTDKFIAEDDRVAMLGSCSFRNRKTGKTVKTPKADFMRFKDGKIVEFNEFYDTAKAFAAGIAD